MQVWLINQIPDAGAIKRILDVCRLFSSSAPWTDAHARQALLVILCPEVQTNNPDVNPFQELLEAVKEEIKDPLSGQEVLQGGGIIKLQLPRLRILERPNWTMLLSRIATSSAQEPQSSGGGGGAEMDINFLNMSTILQELEALFHRENRNVWHGEMCNIIDSAVLSGNEKERIHVLRGVRISLHSACIAFTRLAPLPIDCFRHPKPLRRRGAHAHQEELRGLRGRHAGGDSDAVRAGVAGEQGQRRG